MKKRFLLATILILSASAGLKAQSVKSNGTPTPAQLAAVTARGKLLAEYDAAAWHATDAVEALQPDHTAAPVYLARKVKGQWEVVFGRLQMEADTFLIVYRATAVAGSEEFTAARLDPPAGDRGFYLQAAKAIATATRDFGQPQRPYNSYVLPAEHGQIYVYMMPAQTTEGVYPFGGDVRYTVTVDGGAIADKREMHQTIMEKRDSPKDTQTVAGYHTHVTNDTVEDSDVFHVLTRKPLIPEYVGTPDKHVYEIQTDGTIKRQK